jgi:EamA domain-containing membrane protein RarD
MKGIGFIALILAWSFAIAYAIRKKMNRHAVVKRIEEFKNSNRQTQKN